MFIRALFAALALLMLAPFAQAAEIDPELVRAAEKEGTVVWYTGLIVNQIVRPLVDAFEKKYPAIKVQYSRASNTETTLKILNEARARRVQADVFDVTSGMFPLLEAKVVAPYAPKSAAHFPAEYRDKDGYWTASNLYFLTVAANTNLVKSDAMPRSFDDLLDPKWKGQMAWTSELAVQGPPGFIHNMLATMGQDKGMDYLRKFAAQQPVAVAASPRTVLDQVIAGEHHLGIMMYNHHVAISLAQGAPITWLKMEPLVNIFTMFGVTKDAPHPNAGRLFEEFALSEEGQRVFAANEYLPADPAVPAKTPDLKPEAGHFRTTIISPEMERNELPKWQAIYHDLFR
ncbi:MAG TPA: extracellular solute-binding protein [Stellaceae bacterium]|jgi:ABC-type Fe3+ transport system substrate-binding protein|nr:extracellular solute-binding protein [Stellaceae bacterium]